MHPKDYQDRALNLLDEWVREMRTQQAKAGKILKALEDQGIDDHQMRKGLENYPKAAWEALGNAARLPVIKDGKGGMRMPPYIEREDARGNPIPHACLKIPTGGGKTFLGASALARLGAERGLVLWVVPSKAIYAQTRAAFKNRAHPYREMLDKVSGGRVKLLNKDQAFSRSDLEDSLCIMPLMLQAAARKNERNFLRMFRDTGRYLSMFPQMDDSAQNKALLQEYPDLEFYGFAAEGKPGAVKQSLLNVFKLARPFIVLDEAHNAYSEDRRKQLCQFNPRMILELSATPSPEVSNILVHISGEELRREQMIKLPLNVSSPQNTDWKQALSFAKKKRDELEETAKQFQGESGRYIRPIMLIRVERTGKDQITLDKLHAEEVRNFLMLQMNVPDYQIRLKTAETDEIAGEDLLSEYCETRYIITKSALQEGWDCAFAYVLALLDSTTTARALTQMTGRILRQPNARLTGINALDEAYIFCCNRDVDSAVRNIKKGLEQEGLDDLEDWVQSGGGEREGQSNIIQVERNKKFTDLRILLPVVLHRRKQKFIPLKYESDILYEVPWQDLMRRSLHLTLGEVEEIDDQIVRVDLPRFDTVSVAGGNIAVDKTIKLAFFTLYLADTIPNPFIAAEIVQHTLASLREQAGGDEGLFDRRYQIAEAMKRRLAKMVEAEAKHVFCRKLESGVIRFQLEVGAEDELRARYELPLKDIKYGDNPPPLTIHSKTPQKSLLEPMLEQDFNSLEKDVAVYMESAQAVKWWHRFATRQGYALQGWRYNKVYPDFIMQLEENRDSKIAVIESKGTHLSGNPDTEYKKELLEKLSATNPKALECGSLMLETDGKKRKMVLKMLLQDGWQEEFDRLVVGR